MEAREAFLKFVRNSSITFEDYKLARTYYLEDANDDEIRLYDSFLAILVPALQKAYNKSSIHLKGIAKRHGMTEDEALELIQNFQASNAKSFLLDLQQKGVKVEGYLNNLFYTCQEFNFKKSKIKDFASQLGITYELFLELIEIYMKQYLKLSKNEGSKILRKIETSEDFYTFLNDRVCNDFENVLYYSRNLATQKEALVFDDIIFLIITEFYRDDLSAKAIGEKMEAKYNIPFNNAKMLVCQYRDKRIDNKQNKDLAKYKLACDMFLNDVSYQDISNYLKEAGISWEYLRRNYVEVYVQAFIAEDISSAAYNKILSRMQELIIINRNARRILREKLRNEPFDEETFMRAKEVITKLVYGNKGVPTFLKKLGEETFYRYITLVEMYDEPLYNLYLIKSNRKMPSFDENVIKSIAFYINNGILENGILRKFNILDYFKMVRLPISSFIAMLQNYDEEVKKIIVGFLLKNKAELHPITNVFTSNVDPFEDNIIKNYLIKNDLPMFSLVYMLVLKEYHDGTLILGENSRK